MVAATTVIIGCYVMAAVLTLPFVPLFWRQDVRGNRYMAGIMAMAFVTAITYVLSLVADGRTATLGWYYVYMLTLSLNALQFLAFALVWTDRDEWVRPSVFGPLVAIFVAIPVVGLSWLLATGDTVVGLIWADPGLTELGWLSVYDRRPGPLMILWRVLSTASVLVTIVLLGEFTIRPEQRLYRKQNALLIAGSLSVAVIATAAQLAGVPVEVTPIGYIVTASVFAIAITRFGYFDVVPLASNSIVEELDAGVLVSDTSGRFLDANRTAAEMLGVDPTPGTDVVSVIDAAPVLDDQAGGDDSLTALEATFDGQEFTADERRISASVSEVRGSSGAVVGHRVLLHDVTERYRREQRLERQNERLDEFASFVSHDLRNPLGIARTYLEFARDTGDEDDFDTVEESLDRMDDMIGDLLTMARADTVVDDTDPIALDALGSDAWSTVQTGGATLSHSLDGATVDGDPDLLRHVFENLFRNAVDHNDPPLTVSVGLLDDGDGFYVADDGTGIPEDERTAVVEQGYSTADGGSGLGLAIVSDLVEAHGWDLVVTESSEAGAKFEIRF